MIANDFMQTFEVRNSDINIRFTCPNYGKRIVECIKNLQISDDNEKSMQRKQAYYGSPDEGVEFRFGQPQKINEEWVDEVNELKQDAFFFENTDYPVRVLPLKKDIKMLRLVIGKEANNHVAAENDIIFGTINYHNQVGRTDIKVFYEDGTAEKKLCFSTEVLSYKMDYRTDMRQVIADIEEEFSMLSYSLLKETYQTFRQSNTKSSDLIWWQIFRNCFFKITNAVNYIINRPKQRLKSNVRYERAECLSYLTSNLENEYAEFENNPNHLYRIEEMFLSKDTIENRFLKYALHNINDRFKHVHNNVLSILKADNIDMRQQIEEMNEELNKLTIHPFFRGIGNFRGFTQDSMVMKQAQGYKEIYEQWILLQCGYELYEGIMQLEVKDISELYEIWCFIKIKNMVQHILKSKSRMVLSGHQTKGHFIKSLVQGKQSNVRFLAKDSDIELASVMYNATTDDEAIANFDLSKQKTNISDTTSKTTEQRPDIVLRLSKFHDTFQYTYLFDAKYRLNDSTIPFRDGVDVPPVGAINQMHRYRDAIYYTGSDDQKLKKEVIGGYVLYPGNLNKDKFVGSYYHRSINEVNIGAFPLKPSGQWYNINEDLLLDPSSSEDVLYQQIKQWLEEENSRENLLNKSIPQKGLEYSDEPVTKGTYYLSYVDSHVNCHIDAIKNGTADSFVSGYNAILSGVDIQKIKFFAPVFGHVIQGFYRVKEIKVIDMKVSLENEKSENERLGKNTSKYKGYDKPIRIFISLESYHKLKEPFIYGLDSNAARGITLTRQEFVDYCNNRIKQKNNQTFLNEKNIQ